MWVEQKEVEVALISETAHAPTMNTPGLSCIECNLTLSASLIQSERVIRQASAFLRYRFSQKLSFPGILIYPMLRASFISDLLNIIPNCLKEHNLHKFSFMLEVLNLISKFPIRKLLSYCKT